MVHEIHVGVKVDEDERMVEFGSDEVNQLINFGGRVTAIKPQGALVRRTPDGRIAFVGFGMTVTVESD